MMDPADRPVTSRRPWNEGKLIGAGAPHARQRSKLTP